MKYIVSKLVFIYMNKVGDHDKKLESYLSEIKNFPILKHEEEVALAKQIQNHDDSEAKKQLAKANLKLVVKIAKEYVGINPKFTLLDLIQQGNLGLYKATEKYDYTKDYKFSTYAAWWIRQAIVRNFPDLDQEV